MCTYSELTLEETDAHLGPATSAHDEVWRSNLGWHEGPGRVSIKSAGRGEEPTFAAMMRSNPSSRKPCAIGSLVISKVANSMCEKSLNLSLAAGKNPLEMSV